MDPRVASKTSHSGEKLRGGLMAKRGRLTTQQEEFARLVVEEGLSFTAAFRRAYPPRHGTRSPGAERVAAKRLGHHALVEQRMEQLGEELLASDPVEMRRRANAVLGRILAEQLDPRYRRTAMDVLRYLDAQDRAAKVADQEAYRTAIAQLAAVDAMEGGRRRSARPLSARPRTIAAPIANRVVMSAEQREAAVDQVIDAIDQMMAERRRGEDFELPAEAVTDPGPGEPRTDQPAEEAVPQANESRLQRVPGAFGRTIWRRPADPR
jgi:hypothetical protein